MVNHTYINDKLEIKTESKYVFLCVQPGRWNLIYFQPVGDAFNHGVFMTDSDDVAKRLKKMVESSASGFFKMIKGEIEEKPIIVKPSVFFQDYKNMKWMDLRNYAKEMKMPKYYKSKKVVILEWLDKNVG